MWRTTKQAEPSDTLPFIHTNTNRHTARAHSCRPYVCWWSHVWGSVWSRGQRRGVAGGHLSAGAITSPWPCAQTSRAWNTSRHACKQVLLVIKKKKKSNFKIFSQSFCCKSSLKITYFLFFTITFWFDHCIEAMGRLHFKYRIYNRTQCILYNS